MIQKLDLQYAGTFGDASCQPEIGVTWGRIARRMVVDHAQSLRITLVPGEVQSIIKAVCKIERALRF